LASENSSGVSYFATEWRLSTDQWSAGRQIEVERIPFCQIVSLMRVIGSFYVRIRALIVSARLPFPQECPAVDSPFHPFVTWGGLHDLA
jgi:hypothetical protein